MKHQKLLDILGTALGAALGRNTPATTLSHDMINALHHLNYEIRLTRQRGRTNGAPALTGHVSLRMSAGKDTPSPSLSPRARAARDAAIVAAYLSGEKTAAIMRAHNITPPTIYAALRNAGHAPNRSTRRRTPLLVKAKGSSIRRTVTCGGVAVPNTARARRQNARLRRISGLAPSTAAKAIGAWSS